VARQARMSVAMRSATTEDLPALVALYAELDSPQLALLRRGRNVPDVRDGELTRNGLLAALADPGRRIVLATVDDEPAGFALLTVTPASVLVAEPSVRVDPIVVARSARRRGVGRALTQAAADFAEERGAATLTIAVRPGDRDGNRHFARLGFVPVEVRRVAPVSAVRRAVGGRAEPSPTAMAPALRRSRLRSRAGSLR
jgi:GNAT superfamily N-acetyltransferase